MSAKNAPVHVARIKRTCNGKTYVSVLLRRTYREGGKVRNETVASLSALPAETIEAIERSLKGERLVTLDLHSADRQVDISPHDRNLL